MNLIRRDRGSAVRDVGLQQPEQAQELAALAAAEVAAAAPAAEAGGDSG